MTEFTKIKVTKEFLESLQGYGASKKNNKVKIKSKTPTSISERNKNITNSDEEENIENKKNNTHKCQPLSLIIGIFSTCRLRQCWEIIILELLALIKSQVLIRNKTLEF